MKQNNNAILIQFEFNHFHENFTTEKTINDIEVMTINKSVNDLLIIIINGNNDQIKIKILS